METSLMYRSLLLLCVSCLHVLRTTNAIRDISSYGNAGVSMDEHFGAPPSELRRARRTPLMFGYSHDGATGQRYSARSTRTYSTDEIDAFNQGLHRKRPKFIGKRQVIDKAGSNPVTEGLGDASVACSRHQADDGDRLTAGEKRSPPRKFVGRRSLSSDDQYDNDLPRETPSSVTDNDEYIKRDQAVTVPRRKFVGKRPANRKFVGRRSFSGLEDTNEAIFDQDVAEGDTPSNSDQSAHPDTDHVTEAKRASRKFVG